MLKVTRATDPVLAELVNEELKRQEHNIEMIASESTAPLAVMELTGSVFTNKTLEGYPGKRFQAGSHIADKVEELACQRARELFWSRPCQYPVIFRVYSKLQCICLHTQSRR